MAPAHVYQHSPPHVYQHSPPHVYHHSSKIYMDTVKDADWNTGLFYICNGF